MMPPGPGGEPASQACATTSRTSRPSRATASVGGLSDSIMCASARADSADAKTSTEVLPPAARARRARAPRPVGRGQPSLQIRHQLRDAAIARAAPSAASSAAANRRRPRETRARAGGSLIANPPSDLRIPSSRTIRGSSTSRCSGLSVRNAPPTSSRRSPKLASSSTRASSTSLTRSASTPRRANARRSARPRRWHSCSTARAIPLSKRGRRMQFCPALTPETGQDRAACHEV